MEGMLPDAGDADVGIVNASVLVQPTALSL
jgi:hypothetical protein